MENKYYYEVNYFNIMFAVKILEKAKIKEPKDLERVRRELSIHSTLSHSHIIQMQESINEIIETEESLYMFMDYAEKGELFEYIVKNKRQMGQRSLIYISIIRITEMEARKYFHQLVDALEYIHSKNIVHRDLKPENLLLSKNKDLLIADFGLSNRYDDLLKTACGSPCYAPPEMIANQPYNGLQTDLWSSGIILFALVCGYLPFDDDNTQLLYKKILSGQVEYPEFLSSECKDLIAKILQVNPKNRITIQKVRQHKWLRVYHPNPNKSTLHKNKKINCTLLENSIYQDCLQHLMQQNQKSESFHISTTFSMRNIQKRTYHSRQNSQILKTQEKNTNEIITSKDTIDTNKKNLEKDFLQDLVFKNPSNESLLISHNNSNESIKMKKNQDEESNYSLNFTQSHSKLLQEGDISIDQDLFYSRKKEGETSFQHEPVIPKEIQSKEQISLQVEVPKVKEKLQSISLHSTKSNQQRNVKSREKNDSQPKTNRSVQIESGKNQNYFLSKQNSVDKSKKTLGSARKQVCPFSMMDKKVKARSYALDSNLQNKIIIEQSAMNQRQEIHQGPYNLNLTSKKQPFQILKQVESYFSTLEYPYEIYHFSAKIFITPTNLMEIKIKKLQNCLMNLVYLEEKQSVNIGIVMELLQNLHL